VLTVMMLMLTLTVRHSELVLTLTMTADASVSAAAESQSDYHHAPVSCVVALHVLCKHPPISLNARPVSAPTDYETLPLQLQDSPCRR